MRNPTKDNPADTSPKTVNDFDYSDDGNGVKCPFASHLRKLNPRDSAVGAGGLAKVRVRRINRQGKSFLTKCGVHWLIPPEGIPYGEEVTKSEATSGETKLDRGLLFVRLLLVLHVTKKFNPESQACYQANIANGFHFLQKSKSTLGP